MQITNKYTKPCRTCHRQVGVGAGVAAKENGYWNTYCRDHAPEWVDAQQETRRILTADGKCITPYEPANVPLIKAMPGARWNPNDRCWTVSLRDEDRPRLLEIADQIKLEVAPELRNVKQTEATAKAVAAASVKGLFPFQVGGVEFLSRKSRALLGDDMGTGKTIQALAAIDVTCGVIVIAPASVKYNWRAEATKWRPELKVDVLSGRGSFRFPEPGEMVIINYDILPAGWAGKEPEAISRDCSKVILIVDEAHATANYKAARSQKVKHLSAKCGKVWFLTGTPLLNHPDQLYGVLESGNMAREAFGSWTAFVKLFNATKGRWGGYEWGTPHPAVPEMLRRVMLRRTRDEVLPDLPKKTWSTVEVNGLSASLKRRMDELYEEWADVLDLDEMPPFEEFSAIRALIAEAKVDAMLELVESHEEQEVPLVVFSAHRAPIDELAKREGWATITGDVTPEKRQGIVEAFQSGQLKGIALTIQAGGVGLTLTRAWKALFVDLDWTPALNAQAEDRICRIGQTKPCEIVRMVATHPLEQHVHGLIAKKIAMIQAAVENRVEGVVPETVRLETETEEQHANRMALVKAEQDRIHAERIARDAEEAKQVAKSKVDGILNRKRNRGRMIDETITPERAEAIRQAMRAMDDSCDGALTRDGEGFNKADTFLGKTMARTGLETEAELLTAWYILSGYPRQLKSSFPILFADASRSAAA